MNFSILRGVQGAISCLAKRFITPQPLQSIGFRRIHQICTQYSSSLTSTNNQSIFKTTSLLAPTVYLYNQICGMKQKGKLQLRCRGCYFVTRQERLHVMCRLKPRHKQMQTVKRFKNVRILTFAHQKKERDWY